MTTKSTTTHDTANVPNLTAAPVSSIRTETKKDRMIGMLSSDGGTTISAISVAFGWQPHTTRSAITGLRKAGHKVETTKPIDGTSALIYRIALKTDACANVKNCREAHQ